MKIWHQIDKYMAVVRLTKPTNSNHNKKKHIRLKRVEQSHERAIKNIMMSAMQYKTIKSVI